MADKPKGQPVKLTVTSCVVGYQGKNSRGDDYTIYEIAACRESGEPITDKKLRSFEELPVGELLDLLVTPFTSEKHGLSFTLSRKNKVGSHQRINDLQKELAAVVARIERIENHLRQRAAPEGHAQPAPQTVAQPVAAPVAAPPAQDDAHREELDQRFGADPPF